MQLIGSARSQANLPELEQAGGKPRATTLAPAAWDRFVETAQGGELAQSSVWADAKQAIGFEVVPVALATPSGKVAGGARLVVKRFGLAGAAGWVACGPLLARDDPDTARVVVAEIERVARGHGVRHLVIQPPEGASAVAAVLLERGYATGGTELAPTATIRLDVRRSEDALLAGMKPGRRNNVRRSLRAGLAVGPGSRDDIDAFQQLHAESARRQGFPALGRDFLYAHWDALAPRDAIHLVLAWLDGELVAGRWSTVFAGTMTDRLTGWSGRHGKLKPNVACQWFAIRWAREQGLRWYDFGGIPRGEAQQLLAGEVAPDAFDPTTRYKLEFGGQVVLLPRPRHLTFNPLIRPLVRRVYPRLANSTAARWMINRMRNG